MRSTVATARFAQHKLLKEKQNIVSPTECLETAQSLANMLLLGNSRRHMTSKVHARSWLPLQRLNILSDAWSKLLNIWVRCVTKAKIPRDQYF